MESYDKPRQHIKNQRHYFANKGPSSQSYDFSSSHVWMCWTIKKAEHWRIDVFELWCWRRHLRVSWTARRSHQSILKEVSPEYSLEELMLKLKLLFQVAYFGYLLQRNWKRPRCWERLKAGREGDNRESDGWMASPTQWTWVWANFGSWWWTGKPGMLWSMGLQRVGRNWVTELNWWKGTLAYAIASVLEWFIPGGSDDKESACNAGDLGLIPGLGRSPGGRHGNLLQYSCLQNPMDRGAYSATVHGVTKSWTWLNE